MLLGKAGFDKVANLSGGMLRWRAQRYGAAGLLVDHGKRAQVPLADLIEEIIELVGPDAERLGSTAHLAHAREMAGGNTSAERQRAAYRRAMEQGADAPEACRQVVDMLIGEFNRG